jgi:hypothetical protein
MTLQQPTAATRGPAPFARLYTGLWAILATLALSYLVFLVQHSDRLHTPRVAAAESRPELRQAAPEVEGLRRTIADLQKELADMRLMVAARDLEREERSRAAMPEPDPPKNVPLAETPIEPATAPQPVALAMAEPTTAPPKAAEQRTPQPRIVETAASRPSLAGLAPVPSGKSPPALETGSIAPPAPKGSSATALGPGTASRTTASIVFGPAVVRQAPTPAPVALHLATSQSLDALRIRWSVLSERHGNALRNLEPRYQPEGSGDGRNYHLIAGPIRSADDAKRICAALRAKNEPCSVGGFGGEAL